MSATATAVETLSEAVTKPKLSPSAEARRRRETLIAVAAAKGGTDALRGVCPLAWTPALQSGADPADPATLLAAGVRVEPTINPLFDALMQELGAVRRGPRTYSLSVGKDADPARLEAVLDMLPLDVVYSQHAGETVSSGGDCVPFQKVKRHEDAPKVARRICSSPAARRLDPAVLEAKLADADHPLEGPLARCAITVSAATGQLFFKVCTNSTDHDPDLKRYVLRLHPDGPDMHVWRPDDHVMPAPQSADMALGALEHARASGFRVVDLHGHGRALRRTLVQSVVFQRVPGAPGLSRVVVGAGVPRTRGLRRADLEPVGPLSDTRAGELTCDEASVLLAAVERRDDVPYAVDAYVADVIAMVRAEPSKVEGLQPDQARVVGAQLATRVGLLNASPTGSGKTVMDLIAFMEQADVQPGWRGMAVVKAATRAQWEDQAELFFPECQVRSFVGAKVTDLPDFYEQAGEDPALALLSYDAVREHLGLLLELDCDIDDYTVDEAKVLGNPSSSRSHALWAVREYKAKRAIPMTATPVDRSLDELAAILGFARNDRVLAARKLSREFDLSTPEGQQGLARLIGPTMMVAKPEGIPPVKTTAVKLTAHPDEIALVDGAARHLKRIFDEIGDRLSEMLAMDPDDPALKAAKEELARVRGAVLGGITLARIASVDPWAVYRSKSVGRELLHAEGLLEPALKVGGTKRREAVAFATEMASRGDGTLLFTDFTTIAEHLVADLRDAGVSVALFKGGLTDKRRRAVQRAFQGLPCKKHRLVGVQYTCGACELPSVDVAVLTEAACEGLNFQRAGSVYHADPPWVPSRFVQRVGRAPRIGSTAEVVENIVPVLDGTPEPKIVGRMIRRAAELLAVLYGNTDTDLKDTAIGQAVAGLTDVAEAEAAADEGFFDFLRKAL